MLEPARRLRSHEVHHSRSRVVARSDIATSRCCDSGQMGWRGARSRRRVVRVTPIAACGSSNPFPGVHELSLMGGDHRRPLEREHGFVGEAEFDAVAGHRDGRGHGLGRYVIVDLCTIG